MPLLHAFAWTPARDAAFAPHRAAGLTPGRVVAVHRDSLEVASLPEEILRAAPSGRLRHEARSPLDLPVAGDFVALDPRPREGRAVVRAVLPRTTLLARRPPGDRAGAPVQPLAANADLVLVAVACDRDRLARRAERLVAMAWDSGAVPVLLLTKADLAGDPEAARRDAELACPGVEVLPVSVRTGLGVDGVRARLGPGVTGALLGASGAGKSSLVNRLAGREVLEVGEVRHEDARGRHTTTHRELVAIPGGGCLLDSPGLREAAAADDGSDGAPGAFDDIEALAAACRFRDCAHATEPGCAVKGAVQDGSLAAERWASWERLRRVDAFEARKADPRLMAEAQKLWRSRSRAGSDAMRRKRPPGWAS